MSQLYDNNGDPVQWRGSDYGTAAGFTPLQYEGDLSLNLSADVLLVPNGATKFFITADLTEFAYVLLASSSTEALTVSTSNALRIRPGSDMIINLSKSITHIGLIGGGITVSVNAVFGT